jgi:lipase chaperone LimK
LDANKPVIKQKLWKKHVYYIEELELLLELDANKPVIKQKLWKTYVYYIAELELLSQHFFQRYCLLGYLNNI